MEPTLGPREKLHVPVMHDESIFRANELRRRVYVTKGKMPLRKKGQGHAIHVSDFIVEQTGRLTLSEEQLHRNDTLPDDQRLSCTDSREIIYPGKNHDGFWTNENLMKQVRRELSWTKLDNLLTIHQDSKYNLDFRANLSKRSRRVRF